MIKLVIYCFGINQLSVISDSNYCINHFYLNVLVFNFVNEIFNVICSHLSSLIIFFKIYVSLFSFFPVYFLMAGSWIFD